MKEDTPELDHAAERAVDELAARLASDLSHTLAGQLPGLVEESLAGAREELQAAVDRTETQLSDASRGLRTQTSTAKRTIQRELKSVSDPLAAIKGAQDGVDANIRGMRSSIECIEKVVVDDESGLPAQLQSLSANQQELGDKLLSGEGPLHQLLDRQRVVEKAVTDTDVGLPGDIHAMLDTQAKTRKVTDESHRALLELLDATTRVQKAVTDEQAGLPAGQRSLKAQQQTIREDLLGEEGALPALQCSVERAEKSLSGLQDILPEVRTITERIDGLSGSLDTHRRSWGDRFQQLKTQHSRQVAALRALEQSVKQRDEAQEAQGRALLQRVASMDTTEDERHRTALAALTMTRRLLFATLLISLIELTALAVFIVWWRIS